MTRKKGVTHASLEESHFLVSLLLLVPRAWAVDLSPIALDPTTGSSLIGPSSYVLIDPTRELDLNAAINAWEAGQFQQETAKEPN